MYKRIIRPLLFLLNPETVQHRVVAVIKIVFAIPLVKPLVNSIFSVRDKKLNREVFGLTFENPVGLAAGFDKNASFYRQFAAFGFSFVEVSVMLEVVR